MCPEFGFVQHPNLGCRGTQWLFPPGDVILKEGIMTDLYFFLSVLWDVRGILKYNKKKNTFKKKKLLFFFKPLCSIILKADKMSAFFLSTLRT